MPDKGILDSSYKIVLCDYGMPDKGILDSSHKFVLCDYIHLY